MRLTEFTNKINFNIKEEHERAVTEIQTWLREKPATEDTQKFINKKIKEKYGIEYDN